MLAKFLASYAYGLPGKMAPETVKRESLVFTGGPGGMFPWDTRLDRMKEKTDRMIAEAAQAEQATKALEPANPAADTTDKDSEVPEGLELI